MTTSLEAAYPPFRASLLSGGFATPDDGGWSAELVAAQVALNNHHIAEAAEAVVRGEEVTYDNEASVDDAELSRYADRLGGLVGLAEEIRRSAAHLDHAYKALGDHAEKCIHVRIRDGEAIAYDGPMSIGQFVLGNVTRHVELHHEQLKAVHAPGSVSRQTNSNPTNSSSSVEPRTHRS